MPLKVLGSSGRQGQVLAYLQEICPCLELELVDGVVVVSDDDQCCCMHEIGCTLVLGLADDESCGEIKIKPLQLQDPTDSCGSIYDPEELTLYLCLGERFPSCNGKEPGTPAVTLAHELGHALMHCSEGPNSEARALCVENQVRCELDQPPRCNASSGKKVNFLCDGIYSTWGPEDCSLLERLKCGIARFHRLLWMLLRFRLGCVVKVLGGMLMSDSPRRGKPAQVMPDLGQRLREAEWARERDANADEIDLIMRDLPAGTSAPRVLMLERVVVGRPYLVTLITGYSEHVEVVTNWTREGGAWPPTSPPLVRLVFRDQTLPPPGQALSPLLTGGAGALPPGLGGKAVIDDGVMETLTIGVAGALPPEPARQYGVYADPPTDDETHPDWRRWKAIADFNGLRRQYLYELTPDLVEVIRGSPVR